MKVSSLAIPGPALIEPEVHRDGRGFLVETLRLDRLRAVGIGFDLVQENQSRSVERTIRGFHFQAPPGQGKLVRVARGAILDVIVDIRARSPTLGRHVAVELDDVDHRLLFVPRGFAHGFAVLSEVADVVYGLDRAYDPALERGIAWNDPAIGVDWPVRTPILSERDRSNPRLEEVPAGDLQFDGGDR